MPRWERNPLGGVGDTATSQSGVRGRPLYPALVRCADARAGARGGLRRAVLAALALSALLPPALPARAASGPVRGVLFYSPTCPHCHVVLDQHLPSIFEAFGGPARWDPLGGAAAGGTTFYRLGNGRLELLLVDASRPDGAALYHASTAALGVPESREGLPRLVVGDTLLVGSVEIPARLPGLVQEGLARGGIDWPRIPGLEGPLSALAALPAAPGRGARSGPPPALARPGLVERLRRDPLGNALAIAVLVGMVASLVAAGYAARRAPAGAAGRRPGFAVPLLAGLGVVAAGYLTWVESTGTRAVCGPIGECNAVQQSEYAFLFGVPVGALGLAGYVAIASAWLVARRAAERLADAAAVALLGLSLIGVGFSIYLTFLEPFVIGATCAWCLASALVITALLLASVRPGALAWGRLRRRPDPARAPRPARGGS